MPHKAQTPPPVPTPDELKAWTIGAPLAKSELQVGLEALLGELR